MFKDNRNNGVKYVQSQWRRSGAFILNFEDISHLVLVFLLLTLNMSLPAGNHFMLLAFSDNL